MTGCAVVLASVFGTDAIPFRLSWEGLPGVTRSFDSFSAAAHEAGQSRIWVGFHWSFDIAAGEALGQSVGAYIAQNFLLPRTSPAPERNSPSLVLKQGFGLGGGMGTNPGGGAALAGLTSGTSKGPEPARITPEHPPVGQTPVYPAGAKTMSDVAFSNPRDTDASSAQLQRAQSQTVERSADDQFASTEAWDQGLVPAP